MALRHPMAGSHVSAVQGLRSSHMAGVVPVQVPRWQVWARRQAEVEQALPSARAALTQRPPVNVSSVQGLPSSHIGR